MAKTKLLGMKMYKYNLKRNKNSKTFDNKLIKELVDFCHAHNINSRADLQTKAYHPKGRKTSLNNSWDLIDFYCTTLYRNKPTILHLKESPYSQIYIIDITNFIFPKLRNATDWLYLGLKNE